MNYTRQRTTQTLVRGVTSGIKANLDQKCESWKSKPITKCPRDSSPIK